MDLYDALTAYAASDACPFHMPGHKRRLGSMQDPFTFDITEIDGFDDLHHPEGILKEAQERAAALWHSSETHFLVNGSTAGILTAVHACARPGAALVMARGCHRSAYNAAALSRQDTRYLRSEDRGVLNGPVDPEELERVLDECGDVSAVLLTSRIHCVSGGGIVPRFGKSFRLDPAFDQVTYTGRTGESYCDMKEQFPIGTVSCRVSDMTEPNIRPQESGNRCDCTMARFSDGKTSVTFTAVGAPFELAVKPYTDRALCAMAHREDEQATGVYVPLQAFQQGIGTGACGPAIMPEFQFDARKDYTLACLIRVGKP